MWTYIVRRLLWMIPTLFGVTIVSFCVMQLAPGDPLENQLGAAGMAGQSSQTREAYLLMKRDLKLDRPLVLNFNRFRDFGPTIRMAAHFLSERPEAIAQELSALAPGPHDRLSAARLQFLRGMHLEKFDARLADPEQRPRLATAILGKLDILCRDLGSDGVPAAIGILASPEADVREKIGTIRCLNFMVADPLVYTYSRNPSDAETPRVVAVWNTWWQRAAAKAPQLDSEQRRELQKRFDAMVAEPSREKLFEAIDYLDPDDMRFFAEKLLGESSLREKHVASLALRAHVSDPIRLEAPLDADPQQVQQVAENWRRAHYEPRRAEYEPRLGARLWSVVGDTQYAYMLWRLMTFNFGHSALKTREPVSEKIWNAVIVSAPIMVLAELLIYLVAVPLGIVCAVTHNGWTDRLISAGLFLLYSVPPFVAGMLFLLYFCYGDYLKWFPYLGLHSEGAEHWGWIRYGLDYLWHIALPVVCLSLFSLASIAMFARSSMLDVIGQDYIRTARAKGLSEAKVILKHAFRNALIPVLTLFSSFLPALLGGSVLIEVLFGIPGVGRLSWESISQKDYPTLMALIYFDAILTMVSILLTDFFYVLVDPRISFGGQGEAE